MRLGNIAMDHPRARTWVIRASACGPRRPTVGPLNKQQHCVSWDSCEGRRIRMGLKTRARSNCLLLAQQHFTICHPAGQWRRRGGLHHEARQANDGNQRAIEPENTKGPLETFDAVDNLQFQVLSNVSRAIAELARDHEANQLAIAERDGILPLIRLVNNTPIEQPKEEAAGALWSLSSKNQANQNKIASISGMESLVAMVGKTSARGQEQAAGALASLALKHDTNQQTISQLLVQLLAILVPHRLTVCCSPCCFTICPLI